MSLLKRALRKILNPYLWGMTSLEQQCSQPYFSQFGEDVILKYLLPNKKHGTYVDIGAFHPLQLSNTYLLYQKGWRGIAIDANPTVENLFRIHRPRDTFINKGISNTTGSLKFILFENGAFNCLEEHASLVPDKIKPNHKTTEVEFATLESVLSDQDINHIDFLNIDCEGNDINVLKSNNWSRWKPTVICVEDHSEDWHNSETSRFLRDLGYTITNRAVFTSIFVL